MALSDFIDLAIGLALLYLLLSLIASAAQELLEGYLKWRAHDLWRGISELLSDPGGNGLVDRLYAHPLVRGIYKGSYAPRKSSVWATGGELPSYIPSRTFALALMDILGPAASPNVQSGASGAASESPAVVPGIQPPIPPSVTPLRAALTARISAGKALSPAEAAVLTLVEAAGDDARTARANIEAWFDGAMDRVSGWYKRRTQGILFGLGLLAALGLNADTLAITKHLAANRQAREALAAAGVEFARQNADVIVNGPPAEPPAAETPKAEAPEAEPPAAKRPAAEVPATERLKSYRAELVKLGLPIGWDLDSSQFFVNSESSWRGVLKGLGWLLTALAVSLGATFWFDVLNKFTVIRSTVKPREKSREEGSEDRR